MQRSKAWRTCEARMGAKLVMREVLIRGSDGLRWQCSVSQTSLSLGGSHKSAKPTYAESRRTRRRRVVKL